MHRSPFSSPVKPDHGSASDQIRARINEVMSGDTVGKLLDHFEEVARLAVRLVMQRALEAELSEFLAVPEPAGGERRVHAPGEGHPAEQAESFWERLDPIPLTGNQSIPSGSGGRPDSEWRRPEPSDDEAAARRYAGILAAALEALTAPR